MGVPYCPPDGDAAFTIDLSEKWNGGQVEIIRNDGTYDAGRIAKTRLQSMVHQLWDKRRDGTLNGQDWVTMVDQFLVFVGWKG